MRRADQLAWWLWIALLVTLPITSFPPISEAFGRATVAPLAAVPLIGLLAMHIIPRIFRDRELPALAMPLLLFCGFAALSAAVGLLLPLASFKDQTILEREIRALLTLAIGVGFFLSAAMMPVTNRCMRRSLVALTLGGAAALAWSFVQAGFFALGEPDLLQRFNELHRVISIRDLIPDRVSGFAYEPSWFGNQVMIMYLPIWASSVALGFTAFKRHKGFLTIELVLAMSAAILLLLARTRISILSFLFVTGILIMVIFWRLGGRSSQPSTRQLSLRRIATVAFGLMLLFGIGFGSAVAARSLDPRFFRVSAIVNELPQIRREHPYELALELANRAAFAERVVYWMAGWQVFLEHPVLGVGLGNEGFLFEQSTPAYGLRLDEIRTALAADSPIFPNPKSLWIRLLSETGLVGFAAFLTWLIVVLAGALSLIAANSIMLRALGLAGLLAFLALIIEGLNLDSFALPQMWIIPGLVAAGIVLHRDSDQAAGIRRDDPSLPHARMSLQ